MNKKNFLFLSILLCGFGSLFAKDNKSTIDGYAGTPFGGTAWAVPGVVNAADFDLGGEGVAFHESDDTFGPGVTAPGYYYRDDAITGINDAPNVDIEYQAGPGFYNISHGVVGEWLNYTINVTEEGLYDIRIITAKADGTSQFSLSLDFEEINSYSFPNTGAWTDFTDNHVVKGVFLPAGEHVLTYTFGDGVSNVNRFIFEKAYLGTAYGNNKVPGAIEAEDFDEGGNGVAYYNPGTATNTYRPGENLEIGGSGENVYVAAPAGGWLKYTFTVPTGLTYNNFLFTIYGATTKSEKITILLNGTEIIKDFDVPNSGGNFAAMELPDFVRIYTGENVLTVYTTGGSFNRFELGNPPYRGTPFLGVPFEVPGIIEAEWFDNGGEGIAFHDTNTAGGNATSIEVRGAGGDGSENVQMEGNTYNGEPVINIGWNGNGEWLKYTMEVSETGLYDLSVVTATANTELHVYFDIDDIRVADFTVISANHQTFQKFTVAKKQLTEGIHILKVTVSGNANLEKYFIEKSDLGEPFNGPHTIPCEIEAEDFDTAPTIAQGGEGETYHNPGTIATPNTYRPEVNIEIGGEEGDRYVNAAEGEWLRYTIDAPAGNAFYVISFMWANTKASTYAVYLDNVLLEDELEVPNTGSFSNYEESELMNTVRISQGKHFLTVHVKSGHLDKINIIESTIYLGFPFFGEAFKVPATGEVTFEAEDFDVGGQDITYLSGNRSANDNSRAYRGHLNDGSENVNLESRNEGLTIGNFAAGDWTAYSIEVEEDGIYDVFLLMSTGNDNRENYIKIDRTVYPKFTARTNDWGVFREFATTNVELTAGTHVLYVYFFANFDRIRITKHQESTPYEGTPQEIPGVVEAWKFNEGLQGVAYSTVDPSLGGLNNSTRTESEVNILGAAPNYYIFTPSAASPGWLKYTVDVKEAGTYKATFKVIGGTNASGDGENQTYTLSGATSGYVRIPVDPGAWHEQVTLVEFKETGEQILTLSVTAGTQYFGIESIKFEKYDKNVYGGTPYYGTAFVVPATGSIEIEAEDFDIGGFNISYYDTNGDAATGPQTRIYRMEKDAAPVNLEEHPEANIGNGINLGWTAAGEWLAYSIQVEETGLYDVFQMMSTPNSDERVHVKVDTTSYPEIIARTTGYMVYREFATPNVLLTAGPHVLYIYDGGNFDKIRIAKHTGGAYEDTPQAIPGTFEAWKFDTGGQGLAYSTVNPSYGGDNNSIRKTEDVSILGDAPDYYLYVAESLAPTWLNYTVDVKEAGIYKATFKLICNPTGNNEAFTLSGATSGTVRVPRDPGATREQVTLLDFKEAGVQTLGITPSANADFGLASITFEKYDTLVYGGTPFYETAFVVPAALGSFVDIEAEDFDRGGNKISYYETGSATDGPLTNTYRHEQGDDALVQMETHDANIGKGINIGWSAAGEWTAYSIDVEADGLYDITMTLSTSNDDRMQHIKIDNVEYPEVLFHTSSWADYATLPLAENASLSAGRHVVYVYYSGNFDKLTIGKGLTDIKDISSTLQGIVYVDKAGYLNVKGFNPTASFAVYNLLGQKIADRKITSDNVQTPLPAKGVYIVRVQDKGRTNSFKVIFN
jgi:hypothetical protein